MEIISELYGFQEYKAISDLLSTLRNFNVIYLWDADFAMKYDDNVLWYRITLEMEDRDEP